MSLRMDTCAIVSGTECCFSRRRTIALQFVSLCEMSKYKIFDSRRLNKIVAEFSMPIKVHSTGEVDGYHMFSLRSLASQS